jgi:hypothetical protein
MANFAFAIRLRALSAGRDLPLNSGEIFLGHRLDKRLHRPAADVVTGLETKAAVMAK